MLSRSSTSRTALLVALALVLAGYGLIVGCGSGSPGYVTVGSTSTVGSLQLNVPLASGVQAASRAFNSYTVPTNVTRFRLTFYDNNNAILLTTTVDKTSVVVVNNVPVAATSVLYELLDSNGTVVGTGRFRIVITANQVYVVDPPPYDPVVTGSVALLSTTYVLTGVDTSIGAGGAVTGSLTFDGNGNITAGTTLVRQNATTSPPTAETFNVTGGTYSVAANRDFTATVTTDVYTLTMSGRVTLQPAGGAIYASLYGGVDGPVAPISAFTTLQKPVSGYGNSNVSGTLLVSAFNPSPSSDYNGYLTGNIVADGAGNWTGGTLTTSSGTAFTVSGGTYTVAANGSITGTVRMTLPARNGSNVATFTVTGATGPDQVVSLAGTCDNDTDQIFLLASPKPASVRTINVPATMRLVGARSADGTVEGYANFNAGSWLMTGGFYNDYPALFGPIVASQTVLPTGSFYVSESAEVTGGTDQASSPFVTVGGVFTVSEVVFFSALKRGDGTFAGGNAHLVVLVK